MAASCFLFFNGHRQKQGINNILTSGAGFTKPPLGRTSFKEVHFYKSTSEFRFLYKREKFKEILKIKVTFILRRLVKKRLYI